MTKLSFVIPLYNCLALTQAMLASLRATLPADVETQIIFVDDGSTDGTRAWLATLPPPCVALLNEKNLGFAGACNRGAAAATGEFIFFLNNDLVLLPRWLEPMLAAFAAHPDAGLVGNLQLSAATGAIDHAGVFFNHQGKPAHLTSRPFPPRWLGGPAYRAVDAVTGACFGVRRSLWKALGGFDEGFRNGGEDVDLGLRAAVSGRQNYVALHSVVRHHVSQSAGRKLRDEQNSARLAHRWAAEIQARSTRAWSRHYVLAHADRSHVFDYAGVHAALWHWLLGTGPTASVRQGVAAAFELECTRWRQLLEGEAPPPPPPPVRTDEI